MDIPAVGVFVVVRKSAFRLVFESVARHALRSEEAVVGCWVPGALEEDGREVGDDEGRVIDDALSSLFLASVEGEDVRFPCCTAAAVVDFRVSVLPR